MQHVLKHNKVDSTVTVDDKLTGSDIRRQVPDFFKRSPMYKDQRNTFYRGQIINSHTQVHSDRSTTRHTSVYLFVIGGSENAMSYPDVRNVGMGNDIQSVADAKRVIDLCLQKKEYGYKIEGEVVRPKPQRYTVGRHVQVNMGTDAGKKAVIIEKREIPLKQTGGGLIPDVGGGHYKPMEKDDVAIRYEDGSLDVHKKAFLTFID